MSLKIAEIFIVVFSITWLVSMIRLKRFGSLSRLTKMKSYIRTEACTDFSIIITTQDQGQLLKRNLPIFLQQHYQCSFEVIVVDMGSKDDTQQILNNFKDEYPHLHIITLPNSARDISKERLAITLGVRAASHLWLIFSKADCHPLTNDWLKALASHIHDGIDAILTPTLYDETKSNFFYKFFRLQEIITRFYWTKRFYPYADAGTNLCYKKLSFMNHNGFASHTNLIAGATDIMVNRETSRSKVEVCLEENAFMLQALPINKQTWNNECLYFLETIRYFKHHIRYHIMHSFDILLTWVYTITFLMSNVSSTFVHRYELIILVWITWSIHFALRARLWNKSTKILNEKMNILVLPYMLHLQGIIELKQYLQFIFINKNTFRKKFF